MNEARARLVDLTPTLLAGPVALAGSASLSTPYRAIVDGVDARIYWVEGGLQSIAIAVDAQPGGAPVIEDAAYAQTTLEIAPVGGGRGVQAFYESGAVQVRFLGDSALVPTAGDCNTPPLPAATSATCPPSIGDDCIDNDECITGFCVDGVCCDTACDGECEACSIAAGAAADGNCAPATGPVCDDEDGCSQTSSCISGVCVGANPVADGTICDDSNVCSDTSVCVAGVCVVATPAPDGASCPNLDPCSPSSECQAGACVGVTACLPANDCLDAACNGATGTCDQAPKPSGTPCAVEDLCSESFCNSGVCESVPLNCGPAEACHELPACDATTGACSAAPLADGTLCPGGVCLAGVCDTSMAQGGGPLGGGAEGGASQGGGSLGGSAAVGGDAAVGGGADSPGGSQGGAGENDAGGCDCTTTPARDSTGPVALMLALVALGRASQSRVRQAISGTGRRRVD